MQTRAKLERIVEAVRQGLEGDAAVEFVMRNGFAINTAAIARHLRAMGGRGRIHELIRKRKSNADIVRICLDGMAPETAIPLPPKQDDLFPPARQSDDASLSDGHPLYDTTKVSLRLPSDLFEAIRLAAKAEGTTQNQLIVDLLTRSLSRLPVPLSEDQLETLESD